MFRRAACSRPPLCVRACVRVSVTVRSASVECGERGYIPHALQVLQVCAPDRRTSPHAGAPRTDNQTTRRVAKTRSRETACGPDCTLCHLDAVSLQNGKPHNTQPPKSTHSRRIAELFPSSRQCISSRGPCLSHSRLSKHHMTPKSANTRHTLHLASASAASMLYLTPSHCTNKAHGAPNSRGGGLNTRPAISDGISLVVLSFFLASAEQQRGM